MPDELIAQGPPDPGTAPGTDAPAVLVTGAGPLAEATVRALSDAGAVVHRLLEPTDRDLHHAVAERVDQVVVISRHDHVALRRALVVAHRRPDVPTLVTIFDRHVAAELEHIEANVRVLSMADLVAPALAGPCLDAELMSLFRGHDPVGIGIVDGMPSQRARSWSTPGLLLRALAILEALLRPFDASARILVYGLFGFLAVVLAETLVTSLVDGVPLAAAFYTAAKVTVTVGPSPFADAAGAGFQLFSAVTILLALGFTAVLTAGLVNRLLSPRLTGIAGRSALPRRDHVIVVGLGQVGQRLCELLRDLHIPVIAVEQDIHAKNVPRAKALRLPVVIGDGAEQRTLRQLSLRTARALAAVTSDDVANIAVAVAARGLRSHARITLRAGDGDASSRVESLFHIGVVRDVYRIAGSALAAASLGHQVDAAFPYQGTMYLVDPGGHIAPFTLRPPDR